MRLHHRSLFNLVCGAPVPCVCACLWWNRLFFFLSLHFYFFLLMFFLASLFSLKGHHPLPVFPPILSYMYTLPRVSVPHRNLVIKVEKVCPLHSWPLFLHASLPFLSFLFPVSNSTSSSALQLISVYFDWVCFVSCLLWLHEMIPLHNQVPC